MRPETRPCRICRTRCVPHDLAAFDCSRVLSIKFGFVLDVKIPLEVMYHLESLADEPEPIILHIKCDGGLIDLDLASGVPDNQRVTFMTPKFDRSYIEGSAGLNGTLAASLGIEIDAHIEVGAQS